MLQLVGHDDSSSEERVNTTDKLKHVGQEQLGV